MPVRQNVDYNSHIALQMLCKGFEEVCRLYFQKALRCLITNLDQFWILIYVQISFVSQHKRVELFCINSAWLQNGESCIMYTVRWRFLPYSNKYACRAEAGAVACFLLFCESG